MTNPVIKLVEHKTASCNDVDPFYDEDYQKNSEFLKNSKIVTSEDKKLVDVLIKENILTIEDLKNGLKISPTSYIGIVQFSNFTLQIFPKYSIDSLHLNQLLDYIWEYKPKIKFLDNTIDMQKEDSTLLLEIVIKSLIEQCELLLKQGLYKSYVTHESNITYLRGKLMLKQQITNDIKNNAKFACQFDELEHDNLENQLLFAALRVSHNITKNDEMKKIIRILIHQFTGFVNEVPVSIHDFDKITYNRLNQNYETAHDLARLILESSGIKDYYKEKIIKIKSFFIDMDDVFEKFVEKLFDLYYSRSNRYKVIPQKSQRAWKSETDKDYRIRTDILVTDIQNKESKFIVDTKYKRDLYPQDRYQIGFYIHEHKQNEGTAILPRFPDSTNDQIISEVQGITINLKRIDIPNILDLIYFKREQELFEKINDLIRSDMKLHS